MRKVLLISIVILSILLTAGCSEGVSSVQGTQKSETVSAKEKEKVEDKEMVKDKKLSEEDAKGIVQEMKGKLVEAAKNDDWESFRKLYGPSFEDEVVKEDFAFFKERQDYESYDIELLFQTDDLIGSSYYEYTNLSSNNGNNTNSTNSSMNLYLEKNNGEWLLSKSEKLQDTHKNIYLPSLYERYGEDYLANGYVNNNHNLIFDKVLINNVDVQIYKTKKNSDNSLDLTFAILNGLEKDIYKINFKELVFNYGRESIPFVDLSGYTLEPTEIVYTKDIATISLNIKPEELLVPADQIDFTFMGVSNSINYLIRD